MSDYVENTISHSSWLTLEKVTPEFKTLTLFGKKLLRAYVVLFYYVPNQNKVFLSYLMNKWWKKFITRFVFSFFLGREVIVIFRHLYKNTSHTTILLTHLTWFTCVIFYNSDVRVYIPCVLSFDLVKKTCIYRDKNYLPLWNFEVKFGMRFPISTYENDKFTSAVLIHLWSYILILSDIILSHSPYKT